MKKLNFKNIITIFFVLVPPIVFFSVFFRYTLNIPINDDYNAILDFINKCIETNSISEKIKLIFSQHNEHRIAYDRIWSIISYKVSGQVNFNDLSLIGNLSLIGIFIVFYKKLSQINKNIIYLIPISVLLFNISFYENMTFAMATMSNFTVFLFSLLSLYFLTKDKISKNDFVLAILFFIFATFTQGGGLFLIPICLFILLYKKEKRKAIIYILVSLLVLSFYFNGYQQPIQHPSILNTLIDFKIRALLFSFAFLGNAFDYNLIFTNDLNESIVFTSIIGFIFFLMYLHIVKSKYYKKNLFVFSVMTLLILTSFITGITRCQLGLETAGASRYRINGVIFLLALFLWFIQTNKFSVSKVNGFVIISSLFYFILFSINQYEYLSFRKQQVLLGIIQYQSGDHSKLYGFEQDLYKQILKKSQLEETYFLPSFDSLKSQFPYSSLINILQENTNTEQLKSSLDNVIKLKDSYLINGFAFIENESPENQVTFIGIKGNDNKILYFSTTKMERYDLNPFFNRFDLIDAGYLARIQFKLIPKGQYKIVIKVKIGNKSRLIETDKIINN